MSPSFQTFVGVDLHKCTVTLTAVDAAGEKISRLKISTKSTGKIEEWLLDLPRNSWMAVEACPFLDWFIDRYKPCVDRIDIATEDDLDDYMHEVAGRVGYLITGLFSLASSTVREREKEMMELGQEFGLALQTVNIVRGIPSDIERGWFFVPRAFLDRPRCMAGCLR